MENRIIMEDCKKKTEHYVCDECSDKDMDSFTSQQKKECEHKKELAHCGECFKVIKKSLLTVLEPQQKVEEWEQTFRYTFGEYAKHNKLKEQSFMDWAIKFIGYTLKSAQEEERKRVWTRLRDECAKDVLYKMREVAKQSYTILNNHVGHDGEGNEFFGVEDTKDLYEEVNKMVEKYDSKKPETIK